MGERERGGEEGGDTMRIRIGETTREDFYIIHIPNSNPLVS